MKKIKRPLPEGVNKQFGLSKGVKVKFIQDPRKKHSKKNAVK